VPNRLGQSVYGPSPPFNWNGVSVPVCAASGRMLWWRGGVKCLVGVHVSSSSPNNPCYTPWFNQWASILLEVSPRHRAASAGKQNTGGGEEAWLGRTPSPVFFSLSWRCPAVTNLSPWVNSRCWGTWACFDYRFRCFDNRKLEVESHRRTGHLLPVGTWLPRG